MSYTKKTTNHKKPQTSRFNINKTDLNKEPHNVGNVVTNLMQTIFKHVRQKWHYLTYAKKPGQFAAVCRSGQTVRKQNPNFQLYNNQLVTKKNLKPRKIRHVKESDQQNNGRERITTRSCSP